MSADAVLSLLRKRSADARLWVEAEEWLGQLQSLDAETHQAQGRLKDKLAEEQAAKESLADLDAKHRALTAEIAGATSKGENDAKLIRMNADKYAAASIQQGDAIVADAKGVAARTVAEADKAAAERKAAVEADLADTLAAIETAKTELAGIIAETADKQATLNQVNAMLRSKI